MPRTIRPELLETAPDEALHGNLADLRRINAWFGGHSVLRSLAGRFYRRQQAFRVLDVGAASGDMGRALRHSFPYCQVVSLDRCWRNLRDAPAPKLVADAFHLPFPPRSFDLVMCSLFLHHFHDAEVTALLRSMKQLARRGLIVIDLERNALARAFLPATRWLFGWQPITLHDGPASVDAAFLPAELEALAHRAGLTGIAVQRHRPWFRLSLTAVC